VGDYDTLQNLLLPKDKSLQRLSERTLQSDMQVNFGPKLFATHNNEVLLAGSQV
jgi:hypothetical protein